jgi:hypothetical protein
MVFRHKKVVFHCFFSVFITRVCKKTDIEGEDMGAGVSDAFKWERAA